MRNLFISSAKQLRKFFKFVTMSGMDVKPATIETRTERSEKPSAPKQSGNTASDEQSEGGYW